MILTQRRVMLSLLVFQLCSSIVGLIYVSSRDYDTNTLIGLAMSVPLLSVITLAYWKGFEWTQYVNVVMVSLLVVFLLVSPATDRSISPVILVPVAIALIAVRPAWMAGVATGVLAGLLIRGGGRGAYANSDVVISYIFISGCLILGRMVMFQAQRATEAALQQAQAERARADEAAAAAEQRASELSVQNEEQQRLLDLVATLEVPVVTLAEGVLLSSLVGHVDRPRAGAITQRLLRAVYEQRVRLVVVDVSGITLADATVTTLLIDLARAIQLLGCQVTLCGISASSAALLAQHSGALAGIGIVASPQDALGRYVGAAAG